MKIGQVVGLTTVGLAMASGTFVGLRYGQDMQAARARLAAGSRTIETACGMIEYGESGGGKPVLVVHGAGGGYDQGLTLGEFMLGDGYRVIAPSRFGYANGPILGDGSLEAQADAYACLLDALGVAGPVPVIAFSAGGSSGLTFAVRHADRTEKLVMAAAFSGAPEMVGDGQQTSINVAIGGSFVYWLVNETIQPLLLEVLGIPRDVQATFDAGTRADIQRVMDEMHPMGQRMPGIELDQTRWVPVELAGQVTAPTLVLHCEDDGLILLDQGQHTHDSVAGSRLVTYPSGGHFFAGRMEAVQAEVLAFLAE